MRYPLAQRRESGNHRQREQRSSNQHRHRHVVGGRQSPSLRPKHIGKTERQRRQSTEVAEAPAPAGHLAESLRPRQFGQESAVQRHAGGEADVRHDDRRHRQPQVPGAGERQRRGADDAADRHQPHQQLLARAQIRVGAKRRHHQHAERIGDRQRQRPGQSRPRRVPGNDVDEIGVEDGRQHHGRVARVGEVVHRPGEHLSPRHAGIEALRIEQRHGGSFRNCADWPGQG